MAAITSKIARISLMAMMVVGLLIPAAPASAHGGLPTGTYACYQYFSGIPQYSYFDLHIRSGNRYVFMTGDERVGRAGEFRHASDTKRIRFVSGYLRAQDFKGTHQRSPGDHTIKIVAPVNNGNAYYYCTD